MRQRSRCLAAVLAAVSAAACDNAGDGLGLGVLQTGSVNVQVYLDRDGSGGLNSADTLYPGARITLRRATDQLPVKTAPTTANGTVLIEGVSVGDYVVTVDAQGLGDSVQVAEISAGGELRLVPPPTVREVTIRLAYPELSIRAARQATAGRRVLVRGLVLAGVQSYSDTTSYVRDTSTAVRLTRVLLRGGGAGNNPGDTVTVLGTVSSRGGQPTLDQAIISFFGPRTAPVPLSVTSAVAASAQGGTLDAGLVSVAVMVISESGPLGDDYRLVASDGSGALTIILDANIPINAQSVPVGRSITVRGILVPDGTGKWQLKPRSGGDVTLL